MENNEEKVFEYYLELPEKARMAVIDGMEPRERCRFTRCSKLSKKEATASKNYIYKIGIMCFSAQTISLTVLFGKYEDIFCGFNLSFREQDGQKYLSYISEDYRIGWQEELDEATNLVQCAVEKLRSWVKTYQKTVRHLRLNEASFQHIGETMKNVDFEIESLDNLEVLELFGDIEMSQILPKLRRPLKDLRIKGVKNREYLLDNFELVCQVQTRVHWWDSNLDNQQYLRLKANIVCVNVGQLTEKDVFRFIRSWQNGTVGKDVMDYYWGLKDSNFNERKLLNLLRVAEHEPRVIEIRHFTHFGESAALFFYRREFGSPTIRLTTRKNDYGQFY